MAKTRTYLPLDSINYGDTLEIRQTEVHRGRPIRSISVGVFAGLATACGDWYLVLGVDPEREQNWIRAAGARIRLVREGAATRAMREEVAESSEQ